VWWFKFGEWVSEHAVVFLSIDEDANTVISQLCLYQGFYNISFKIKHALCIALRSPPRSIIFVSVHILHPYLSYVKDLWNEIISVIFCSVLSQLWHAFLYIASCTFIALQFSSRPLRCSAVVPAENKFQGPLLHDSCYKGYLSVAAFRLH
jgi:hypothetical protein